MTSMDPRGRKSRSFTSLVVALTVIGLGSFAIAQPAPPVTPVDKGAATGSHDGSSASPGAPAAPSTGTDTAGNQVAAPAGSAAGSAVPVTAGSGAVPAAGAGSAAPAAPGARAWYDVLAYKPIEESGNFWMPRAVNKAADASDMMFYSVLGLSAFFFFAIAGVVIYFVIKYRHRPGHKAEPSAGHNDALEITWTIIPTIICVFLFWYGWRSYIHVVTPPQKAVEINVIAWR